MTPASTRLDAYEISIASLPLPRGPLGEAVPAGHSISPRYARTKAEALVICQELVQAGYVIEVQEPNGYWDQAEIMRRLKAFTV